jgi:hypothetical protein
MAGQDHDPAWRTLINKLKVLPEPAMRREVLGEQLVKMQPEQVLEFFDEVTSGAARRKPDHLIALEAVHETILQGQEEGYLYELLAEVYRLAREMENQAVTSLMMIAQPKRGPIDPADAPIDPAHAELTLGERKYLARGQDRMRLDRLLFDPDPAVITNLLKNPNLTEQDVIRLAAKRPIPAEVLRVIHKSRFSDRYRIRLTLVCNPYTPPDIAVKLTGFLLLKDLIMVSQDGALHQLVRDEARRVLAQKKASPE